MMPLDLLKRFDAFLSSRNLEFEAVVIGGAAMNLLGLAIRPTEDCDILEPTLPSDIVQAAIKFSGVVRSEGEDLSEDWLNNGPLQLGDVLNEGWRRRTVPVFEGKALRLRTLGREDLLCAKLFALCDRGTDFGDCVALAPTEKELEVVLPWLQQQDAHQGWPNHVLTTLKDLGKNLGHGV